ncbi:hypothetical protein XCR1_4360001 [Xenorhabdus cabanillasii JM26]|uniref:Uncharacterized protein n=1 Tax=Xenorhabdus cabanillasii JM26 TaxID=1427517 RepID=W1J9X7_9GAMM|nr:hypothetical protein XCR1_4360001 [Xenorhabdus cabanillasii JM26]
MNIFIFDERKRALALWANMLVSLEKGDDYNVTPLRKGMVL